MDKAKEWFSKTSASAKEKWTGFAAKTRIAILAVAGVIIVSAIIITAILNTSSDAILTKTSGSEEAQEVVLALATAGITDVRVDSNDNVHVSDKVLGPARVALSEAGLPRPGFNNDTFNNNIGMFTTDTEMNEYIKQQYMDWISAYLSNIPEVERSMVILHIPKTSNYVMVENKDKEEARASVGVTLKSGKTLSNDQIKGIHSFVRNSVPGLEDYNITVTDGNSIELIPDDMAGFGSDSLALQQQRLTMEAGIIAMMADAYEARLNPLLSAAFGENGHYLSVNVDVDFSEEHEVLDEEFTPIEGLDGGIIRKIQEKAAAGGVALEGGPIGTFVNSDIGPDYPTFPDVEAGGEFYLDWAREVDYEINRRVETYKDTGLRIKNRTASLVVNSEPMTPAELEVWEGIVANATGATQVQVVTRVFPIPPTPIEPSGSIFSNMTRSILIWIIIALGVLLVILFVLAITTSGSKKRRLIRNRGLPLAADGAGGYLTDDSFQPLPPQEEGFELQSLLEENDTKDVVLKREIKEFSKSNPEIIAQLIRTWLRDDEV
ncbi:MAG: hypothetical protein FWG33_00020 [Oscillospiraceae bacterium]|nr:hypothetical protein [Oscillospiraceae bacterium]